MIGWVFGERMGGLERERLGLKTKGSSGAGGKENNNAQTTYEIHVLVYREDQQISHLLETAPYTRA